MTKLAAMFAVVAGAAACGGGSKGTTPPGGGADGVIALTWQAKQADGEHVEVTLVVGGTPHVLGKLNAAADDAQGTPRTCDTMPSPAPTSVGFTCGGTPAFNHYRVDLRGAELVITLETGVDGEATSEKSEEVKRIPVKGGSLTVAPYVKPAG
ncbi:MAG: hypothetical protein KF773_07010 [Deltaproteobacteria bacterium]|nr:hypothetical protein [Deltaproteobacteria bacterium]